MGCTQSTKHVANSNQPSFNPSIKNGFYLLGTLAKGSMVIRYSPGHIQSVRAPIKFPKYANAFISGQGVGFMTGGVEELQSTSAQLKSPEDQQYQGLISKRFIKIDLIKLPSAPSSSFQQMPEMINARYAHCAVQHNFGIFVMGGRQYGDDQIGILSACQKFDFSLKKWKAIPSLRYPRAGACALVYGHLIYVFGGYTGKNQRNRIIESYEQGDAGWRKLPYKLHQGLQGAFIIKNPENESAIFLFGGKTNDGKVNDTVEINISKQTVQKRQKMLQERCFHKGYLHEQSVHLIGGGTDAIEFYDIQKQESTMQRQLSFLEHCSPKQLAALSALQKQVILKPKSRSYQPPDYPNKVYIFGHSKQPFAKIIDTDRMVVISEGQNLRHNFYQFPTVAKVNKETTFVMGGINSEFTQVTDLVYSFNIKTEQIKYLESLKMPKYGFSATVKGSYLYIAGGRKLGGDDVAILSACQRYSFQTYGWESLAPLKHKRHSGMLIAVGNFLMIIGGYKGNGNRSNDIEMYVEAQNRWIEIEQKFELAAESMTPVSYKDDVYIFGGRAEQIDIQKVFKLKLTVDEGIKYEKAIKTSLEPIGNLSFSGTNLKVFLNKQKGLAYVFGNVKSGIDVYDFNKNKIVSKESLSVFMQLKDPLFQKYTIIF